MMAAAVVASSWFREGREHSRRIQTLENAEREREGDRSKLEGTLRAVESRMDTIETAHAEQLKSVRSEAEERIRLETAKLRGDLAKSQETAYARMGETESALRAKINDATARLDGEQANADGRIADLEQNHADARRKTAESIDVLRSQVASLENKVLENHELATNSITELTEYANTLEGHVSALDDKLSGVETHLSDLDNSVTENTRQLNGRVLVVERSNDTLADQLTGLEAGMADSARRLGERIRAVEMLQRQPTERKNRLSQPQDSTGKKQKGKAQGFRFSRNQKDRASV